MKTIGQMIQQIDGLVATPAVSPWEDNFIRSIVKQTQEGKKTSFLSGKQVEAIELLYKKHFA